MRRESTRRKRRSFLDDFEAVDWAWLVLTALIIVVIVCMVINTIESATKGVEATESDDAIVSHVADDDRDYYPPRKHIAESEEESEPPMVVAETPPRTHIGKCRMTVYTPTETHWGYTTATGVKSQHLMTCAVDPKVIPYGSNVIVIGKDGAEYRYKAIDCGNFKGKWVDIFFDGSIRHGIEWLDENLGEWADVWIEECADDCI